MIAIAKTGNLVMFLVSFLATCKYEHAEHSFGYTQFDTREGDFIVPFPTSLVKEASNAWLAMLITLCGSDPVMSPLALKRSAEFNWSQYIEDELRQLRF